MALRRSDAERLELARLDVRQRHRNVDEQRVDVSRDDVGDRGCDALVRHVTQVRLRHVGQKLHRKMRHAADARRRHRRAVLLLAGVGDELGHRARRIRGARNEHLGGVHDERHRCEIAHRVVGQLVVQRRADRDRAGAGHEQRQAVGGRLGHVLGRDAGVRAGLVLDDHRVAELLAELLGHHARDEVDRPARREAEDEPRRLALRERRVRRGERDRDGDREQRRRIGVMLCSRVFDGQRGNYRLRKFTVTRTIATTALPA